MIIATFGTVLKITPDGAVIKDRTSGEEITGILHGDLSFILKEGDEGLFLGARQPNKQLEIRRFDPRKLLNPLHEEDMFGESGKYTMVETIECPFLTAFLAQENKPYYDSYAEELVRQRDLNEESTT